MDEAVIKHLCDEMSTLIYWSLARINQVRGAGIYEL